MGMRSLNGESDGKGKMKEKLRLAVFGHKRWSREGGVEIVVKELCTRMAQQGCQVTCYNRAGHHVSGAEYDDVVVYFAAKSQLDKIIHRCFPCLVILYWIMSEGTLLAFGKSVQPFMYRNWLVEGVGFYYMGKWIRKHECQRKTLSIGILIIGSIVTTAEYRICGRLEFYFGNLPMVYGMLALGKTVHIKDNILSMIGSKHSLHLYLYSPFVACVFSLLQMILFQTTRHQEVITVVVVLGTTWLVMQGWFIRAIEKLKIA